MVIWGGVILFYVAILSFALSAVCGGGASFILIPVLGLLLPGAQVPAALSIGTASSSVSRIVIFWSSINWKIVYWFVPAAIPAIWLGAKLLTYMNPMYLELVMGIFLISNISLLFKKDKGSSDSGTSQTSFWYLLIIGIAAGFVSGLTGAVGLLFNRFYLRYGLNKEQIVATRAANELLLHLIKLGLYASFGLLTTKVVGYGLLIAVAAVISSWVAKKTLPLLSENLFKKVGYGAMVVSGAFMLVNASLNVVSADRLSFNYKPLADGSETSLQWRKSSMALEFEYNEGFELEYTIKKEDLPADKQTYVQSISYNADKVLLEEVYGIGKHYYEAYVYTDGKLKKYDF